MNEKKKENELKEEYVFDYEQDDKILEVCLGEDNIPFFAMYDKNAKSLTRLMYCNKGDNTIIMPSEDDEVLKKIIKLPSKIITDVIDEKDVFHQLFSFFEKWVDVNEDYARVAAHYVMFSYIYNNFLTLPYLRVRGDMGCGKSRFLLVMNELMRRSLLINGSSSAPAVYRIINKCHPSICFDEMDMKSSDEKSDFIKILNSGFSKGQYIMKCKEDKTKTVEFFDAYGCKVISTRGQFDDVALESRCFTEIMISTTKPIPIELDDSFFKEAQELRNKLFAYQYQNYDLNEEYKECRDIWTYSLNVENRIKQISQPLYYCFWQTENTDEFSDYIKRYTLDLLETKENSRESVVLQAYIDLRMSHLDYISSSDIEKQIGNNYYTSRSIGRLLRSLGFTTKMVLGGKKRNIVIDKKLLESLKNKYICNNSDEQKEESQEDKILNHIKNNEGIDILNILDKYVSEEGTNESYLVELIEGLEKKKKIEKKGGRYYIKI